MTLLSFEADPICPCERRKAALSAAWPHLALVAHQALGDGVDRVEDGELSDARRPFRSARVRDPRATLSPDPISRAEVDSLLKSLAADPAAASATRGAMVGPVKSFWRLESDPGAQSRVSDTGPSWGWRQAWLNETAAGIFGVCDIAGLLLRPSARSRQTDQLACPRPPLLQTPEADPDASIQPSQSNALINSDPEPSQLADSGVSNCRRKFQGYDHD